MKENILSLVDTIKDLKKCSISEALEMLMCIKIFMEKGLITHLEDVPEYVLIKISDNTLKALEEVDYHDILSVYKWELAKTLKKFETEELLFEHTWIKVLEALLSGGIKRIVMYVDSPLVAIVSSRVLAEKISIDLCPIRPSSHELVKRTLKVLSNSCKRKYRTKTLLIVPIKFSKKDINEIISLIKRASYVGSLVVLLIPRKIFLARKGILSYLTLGDCTFLSILSSMFLGERLSMIIMVRSYQKTEPFPVGDRIGVVRYSTPLIVNPKNVTSIDNFWGVNPYNVQEGLITGKDEAYVVITLEDDRTVGLSYVSTVGKRSLGFRNAGFIERDVLYPVVRFSDLRWPKTITEYCIVLPIKDGKILEEEELKRMYPNAHAFFLREKDKLLSRRVRYYQVSQGVPFYYVNVSNHMLAPYKVAWKSIIKDFYASLIEPQKEKPVILLSGIQYIPIYDRNEALYLFALLNSSIIKEILAGNEYNTKISIKLIKSIKIPKYNREDELHRELVRVSSKAIKSWNKTKNIPEDILEEMDNIAKNIINKSILRAK
ncbi:MAG: hypothetical protein J7J27_03155 [Euryarchaeota archaeon]|nr:hypothetical protein [Euryarchaeota archaeon]